MREDQDVTKRNVATINLQLYNESTEASVVALVRSRGTTELRKGVNLRKTTLLSSLILLELYFNNRKNKIKIILLKI
jgi:hypothetical protein